MVSSGENSVGSLLIAMAAGQQEITQLLLKWSEGDQGALDRLLPVVYPELRRIARNYMRRENAQHTLQTSALINEAYLRLVDHHAIEWQDRSHFFAVAAQVMRHILVDHARFTINEMAVDRRSHCAASVASALRPARVRV